MNPTVSATATATPSPTSARLCAGRASEQPVLDQRRGPGELLEQCALAGVGVADESDGRELGAPLALHLALALDQIERSRSVPMRRRMTRRSLSSWVSPTPRVPIPPACRERCAQRRVRREHLVGELRQLDLDLRLPGARTQREDVEDHPGAVEDLDVRGQCLVEVAGPATARGRRPNTTSFAPFSLARAASSLTFPFR